MRIREKGRGTPLPLRRGLAALCAAALLLTSVALPAGAQGEDEGMAAPAARYAVPTMTTPVSGTPELVVEEGTLRLQLEDAIAIALRRNLDISLQRFDREQSLLGIHSGRGIYDLRSSLDLTVAQGDSPSALVTAGVPVLESDFRRFDFGLSQLTPWGGVLELGIDGTRQDTNNQDVAFRPLFNAGGNLTLTQPLLRGFGYEVTNQEILVAQINSNINIELFEQQVSSVLLQVEQAYWSLVEAQEQLGVARESLTLAEDLHERNRIQVEVGTLAPIELVQSEATIAQRQEDIITAEARLRDAGDELLRLLNLPDAMAEGLEVVPVTEPSTEAVEIDVDAAIALALEERPELRSQQLAVDRLAVDAKVARNQLLPQANLVLDYSAEGQAGSGVFDIGEGEPLIIDTDLGDALNDVWSREFTGWSIGLSVAFPIQNRRARAQRSIADLELQQARTELDQLRLGVITEVRAAARAVRTALQQIESARVTRRLQERNLEAEQKRYENGMSDSFRISQIQNDLTAARSREVTSVTNYRSRLASYHQAIGRLVDEVGIELVGPGYVEPERGFSLFGLLD